MSTHKTVYNKLFPKQELSAEKVELASIQMIEAMIRDGKDILKRGEKFANERDSFLKEARRLNSDAKGLLNGITKEISEFEKQAKELGVNPSTLPAYKQANDITGVMDTIIKQTQDFK
jgi:hypothetical protein